jgi:hypothetical protein
VALALLQERQRHLRAREVPARRCSTASSAEGYYSAHSRAPLLFSASDEIEVRAPISPSARLQI